MAAIALICEGVSEIKMLTYIIERYLGENVAVNPIQPSLKLLHGQEKQSDNGGWLQVLNHCTDEMIKDIMASNDFLVLQIDTDACAQANYDVDIYDENHHKVADEILYKRVCDRLRLNISKDIWNEFANRIIFAICFDEIECWLLPLYYANDAQKRCATNNCIFILNQMLQKEGLGIPSKEKNTPEAAKVYQKVLKKMKRKEIPNIAQYNYGFQKFVEQMDAIKDEIAGTEQT